MTLSSFQSFKLSVVAATGLTKDALHIYVGLTIFLLVVLLFRRSPRSWAPWGAVLIAACIGEFLDMRDDIRSLGHWRWLASLHDIVNTMFWPTVLMLLARFTRLFRS